MTTRTFSASLAGVGDEVKIQAEAERILGGATTNETLQAVARAIAELQVLTVTAPDGWDVEEVDPFDDDAVAEVMRAHGGLRAAEVKFRLGNKPDGAPTGS